MSSARLAVAACLLVALSGCTGALGGSLLPPASPALVSESALDRAGYVELNNTSVVFDQPTPVGPVAVGGHVAAYFGPVPPGTDPDSLLGGDADDAPATDPGDLIANGTLVTVFSLPAAEAGPVALNPLVYAADPALLSRAGFLLDVVSWYLTGSLVDLEYRGGTPVTVLGVETEVSEFSGRLAVPTGDSLAVTVSVVRVVDDGDLVLVLAVAPVGDSPTDDVRTLAGGIVHPATVRTR